jgi:hypothetical protein
VTAASAWWLCADELATGVASAGGLVRDGGMVKLVRFSFMSAKPRFQCEIGAPR